jgi:hypothetical protein
MVDGGNATVLLVVGVTNVRFGMTLYCIPVVVPSARRQSLLRSIVFIDLVSTAAVVVATTPDDDDDDVTGVDDGGFIVVLDLGDTTEFFLASRQARSTF